MDSFDSHDDYDSIYDVPATYDARHRSTRAITHPSPDASEMRVWDGSGLRDRYRWDALRRELLGR